VDPKQSSLRVICEDVNRKSNSSSSKPQKPAPILLILLNLTVPFRHRGQETIHDHIAAHTAVIDVLAAIDDYNTLSKCDFVRHFRRAPNARAFFPAGLKPIVRLSDQLQT